MSDSEVSSFYENEADEYDQRWSRRGGIKTAQSQWAIVDELTRGWDGKRILELGCGTGRFSLNMSSKGKPTILMDIALQMLGIARSKMRSSSQEFNGVNGSVDQLPFENSWFDAAYSINVFNHLDDLKSAFSEVNRILKKDGLFLVNFANLYSYYFPLAFIINRRHKSIGRNVYSRWLSIAQMKSLFDTSGFSIIRSFGNVYVPAYLDQPVIREIPLLLNKISRNTILKSISPSIFYLCRKDKDNC